MRPRAVALLSAALNVLLLCGLAYQGGHLDRILPAGLRKGAAPEAHYRQMVAYHGQMDPLVPEGAIIFIGDSITQGLAVSAVVERGVNYGIGGDTIGGVARRIGGYGAIGRARAVVLAVGINDLGHKGAEEAAGQYGLLLSMIGPQVPVIVSAVLPVDEARTGEGPSNAGISGLNGRLKGLCEARARCVYVDAGPRMRGPRGGLPPELHRGDGVHLSPEGYRLWIDSLRGALDLAPTPSPTEGSP